MGSGGNSYTEEGSFTIEAAFILCLTVLCLLGFIYGCLYLHDKTVLEGAASLAAQKSRLMVTENQVPYTGGWDWESFRKKNLLWRITGAGNEAEAAAAAAAYAGGRTAGRLLVCGIPEFFVTVKADCVSIRYHADTLLKGLFPMGGLLVIPQISGEVKDRGMEAEEFLRLVKALTSKEPDG